MFLNSFLLNVWDTTKVILLDTKHLNIDWLCWQFLAPPGRIKSGWEFRLQILRWLGFLNMCPTLLTYPKSPWRLHPFSNFDANFYRFIFNQHSVALLLQLFYKFLFRNNNIFPVGDLSHCVLQRLVSKSCVSDMTLGLESFALGVISIQVQVYWLFVKWCLLRFDGAWLAHYFV